MDDPDSRIFRTADYSRDSVVGRVVAGLGLGTGAAFEGVRRAFRHLVGTPCPADELRRLFRGVPYRCLDHLVPRLADRHLRPLFERIEAAGEGEAPP
ncbi:MAG: hypothetical protein GX442_08935 [Candidatus Riflebacteria bacterium]|nr:hypothetical protein [Candidatus Riflebacteria bacterium]